MDVTLPDTHGHHNNRQAPDQSWSACDCVAWCGWFMQSSNMVFFGAIDFFCTNGMIRGEHDKVRRKNTTFFNMPTFERQLQRSKG